MKIIPRLLIALLAFFALSGCLQIDTLISVRADGTGTVREKVQLSDEAVEMIRQMEEMAQQSGGQTASTGIIDREELQRRASAMGPGVSLVSVEELPGGGGYGYEAVWAFEDVNTLRVVQDAEGAMPQPGAAAGAGDAGDKPGATFRLEPGSPAVLHVTSTLAGGDAPAASAAPAEDAQVPPEMIREMFQGMRFSIAVEVEGAIVETNASHQSGSRVTLFELDFDRLLESPKAIALLSATDAPDPMQMKDALRGLPGIRVETETDLKVAFVPANTDIATAMATTGAAVVSAATLAPAAGPSVATGETAPAGMAETATTAAVAAAPAMPETDTAGVATAGIAPEVMAPAADAATPITPAPDAGGSSMATATSAADASASTAVAATAAESPTPMGTIAGYSWRDIAVGELAGHRFKLVAVTDSYGAVTKGMVMAIDSTHVQVRRASMDGGGTIDLPLSSLRSASVFEQGS